MKDMGMESEVLTESNERDSLRAWLNRDGADQCQRTGPITGWAHARDVLMPAIDAQAAQASDVRQRLTASQAALQKTNMRCDSLEEALDGISSFVRVDVDRWLETNSAMPREVAILNAVRRVCEYASQWEAGEPIAVRQTLGLDQNASSEEVLDAINELRDIRDVQQRMLDGDDSIAPLSQAQRPTLLEALEQPGVTITVQVGRPS